ncbi:MAG: T9SS type A sorting domain-containing protein [Bacteroidia bacterium]|nr:T9SS type A sorting domain-containing protein [Bacteroidia bacterium]
MKTKITLICLLIAMNFASKAQNYVTIPDTNFVAYLQTNFPTCMNGNLMDTTCAAIQNNTSVSVNGMNISDLTGIQYFTSLTILYCNTNQLTSLPPLPDSLQAFYCGSNQLSSLPALPSSLIYLHCAYSQLTSLPSLPSSLQYLNCSGNQLTNLPALSNMLAELECSSNQLTSLPTLPASLFNLFCPNNQLTSLPSLPNSVSYLNCSGNQLTSLPSLPNSLTKLYCSSNQLTTLPTLPSALTSLVCNNNNISCFPKFPSTLIDTNFFSITSNPFTCLPNYVPVMNSGTLAYPLCVTGDSLNNTLGCPSALGIVGYTYKDNNTNCIRGPSDLILANIPIILYDNINSLLSQAYSLENGIYNFSASVATYLAKIDTAGMPFTVQCAYPGIDSTVTLTNGNPLATDINFAITCKLGFDVGVQSVFQSGSVFPGQQHELSVVAGDMSQWYNLNCANGISGQVQITVTGPVTYTGIALGALTPTITGNVFTYTIADFGTINNAQDFGLLFTTDTTAQAGDQICVNVTVTPINGDNNISNNNYQFCYQVINSYDPNLKEVYPVNVLPGYQDWFTYTIHFQNTGTAPAFNIRLVDTLSNNLDMETFQIINYSHHNTISIQNKILTVRFPNIMLPDSTSNLESSKGFVQYRVKPKPSLPLGTQIQNTAYIYFDYNPPIVTNTTINEYTQTASIKEIQTNASISVYPNPGNGKFKIQIDNGHDNYQLSIYNILGEKIYTSPLTPLSNWRGAGGEVDLSQQPNGIYIVRVNGSKQSLNYRIIKQ